jgi:predicted TPR repeat methyltransferase
VLDYTKTSGSSYAARKYPAGYHALEILGTRLEGQRDPKKRFEIVPVDFHGKTVLDIGSNQGGMLLQLRDVVARGVGIDFDHRMVNAANRVRASVEAHNLGFYVFDLEKEPLALIRDFLPAGKVDVVFLLAVCMWLGNWREVIDFASSVAPSMLFETNGSDAQQDEQEQYLREKYASVRQLSEASEDDPSQKRRKLFWLTNLV